eukprot:scaffold13866_cov490-Alexandrium_tamarense.AAC.1
MMHSACKLMLSRHCQQRAIATSFRACTCTTSSSRPSNQSVSASSVEAPPQRRYYTNSSLSIDRMKPKSSRSGGWIQRSNNDTDNLTSRSTNTTTSTGNHTTIKSSTAKHSKTNNFRSFLTPGYQQNTTTITTKDAFNNTALPILDASVILSPGRYVKKSFPRSSNKWSTSGVDAAQRLVDGRREFVHVVEKELFGDINDSVDRDSGGGNDDERGF